MLTPALSRLREQLLLFPGPASAQLLLRELDLLDTHPGIQAILGSVSALPPVPAGPVNQCTACGCDVTACA